MPRFVLITRHPADCEKLQELLRPADIVLRPFPVLRLAEVDDKRGWKKAAKAFLPDGSETTGWLLLASPRAPERLVKRAVERSAEHILKLPAAAVGQATAEAAEAAGLRVEVIGPGTGAGLAEMLIQRWPETVTALFACGHHRRSEMPTALTDNGHTVIPVELYDMQPTPQRELPPLGPNLEAVVLTSPRSARYYLDGVGGLPLPCAHWALGPTTRDAAESIGISCRIPSQPSIESLAEELCRI